MDFPLSYSIPDTTTSSIILSPPCRHSFFTDVVELRAQERERNLLRRTEVLERRQKQMEELAEKKKGGSS